MITKPPAKLKVVAPFILRGLELEKVNPIIAYYCFYTAVESIIKAGLQEQDEECKHYAINLIEELEKKKAALGDEPAIQDKMVGQAYVEDFALRIFHNAEATFKARKVTKRTAETFRHAALFMTLLKFFGDMEPETQKKITFAKFQANRILKAIAAGEDPNPPEEKPTEQDESANQIVQDAWASAGLDGLEQRGTPGSQMTSPPVTHPPPPFLPEPEPVEPVRRAYAESVSDGEENWPVSRASAPSIPPLPRMHTPDVPSAPPSAQPQSPYYASSPHSTHQTQPQRGLPSTGPPSFTSSPKPPPAVPAYTPSVHSRPQSALSTSPPPQTSPISHYQQHPSAPPYNPPQPPSMPAYSPPPTNPFQNYPPPQQPTPDTNNPFFPPTSAYAPPPPQQQHYQQPPPQHYANPAPPPMPYGGGGDNFVDGDDAAAIKEAQKRAKWAISALNFEDVPTAVKELRAALKALGARI